MLIYKVPDIIENNARISVSIKKVMSKRNRITVVVQFELENVKKWNVNLNLN